MESNELVTAIRDRARLRSDAEAQQLLEGVLQALAHVLPRDYCDVVCRCVPDAMVWCLHCGPRQPDPLIDSELFLGWVMSSIETTGGADETLGGDDPLGSLAGDEARARVRIVLDELWARMDRTTAEEIMACLPCGIAEPSDAPS